MQRSYALLVPPREKNAQLDSYRRKRDFGATPEPAGGEASRDVGRQANSQGKRSLPRFVVQQHHATRLHWDLRLERDGVLVSWAIPNGIPPDRSENRLAVHTEDHPLEYLEFHGEIPKGSYGAGSMTVWDTGTYETIKFDETKVEVIFHGERLHGRYGLFPIGRRANGGGSANDWMIHRMDPPDNPDRVAMPERLLPMLARAARPGELPHPAPAWSFEVKWDGVRAIAYAKPGRLRIESRNQREITGSYPELRVLLDDLGMHEAVLDGEIVCFGPDGRPDFGLLQKRMHVSAPAAVKRLSAASPVVYAIFDLLYLDGVSLMELPYEERRAQLTALELGGSGRTAIRVPSNHVGDGERLLEATRAQGLEGIVAKRLDSRYEPGKRNGAWLKIKHTLRQELVIAGWLPGEGRRQERIGALLMGVHDGAEFVYAGRVGTGFTERTLDDLAARLAPLRVPQAPFTREVKLPREAVFVEPSLVAEVEFTEWTHDGVMRAPSFKGLRDDKPATEVVLESPMPSRAGPPADVAEPSGAGPEALFDSVERLPSGDLLVTTEGRELKLTNWDKVLFPEAGFTKGDLISYYARVAGAVLPHLRDRPLTLKRYPNGVDHAYFYEKQSPAHRPDWVQTETIGDVRYTLAQDRPTLIWLANLADVELHTSLAYARDPEHPNILAFDLDPGPPAGLVECCEVALLLRGLFDALGLQCRAKTSGSKGMQVYVPIGAGDRVDYHLTKPFARKIAEALEQRLPKLVVSRMTKRLRPGRVFVDWSQNDEHKTTVTVYSVRARPRATVSTPLHWEEVERCHRERDPELLTFETEQVIARVAADGDLFADVVTLQQALPRI